ncbi:hypothetical protein J2Z83_003734 [Virgibacillus natechei]|uniref:Minor capsid protein n=1 Tax=Virgibacillus natechei TaxID=1216297 RepID=A0ABS4IKU4_9BACI|nr:putative minor capsid protein [Virgibacillus natechei]MBP1971583.1 hypothetical protein [Virgibacillus natechei]UZD13084.1 minor capsid protein [Virgibacillus natechei]
MVKSIPSQLLIHTIEYEAFAGNDGWDDTWAEPITIKNVRVEPTSRLQRSNNSEGAQISHVVFVDRVNSSHFPVFTIQSRVIFEGVSREVIDVKPFYTFDTVPHHYEIELG